MPLDQEMAEIAQVFFAECRENLDVMESGLLRMDSSDDVDNVNTVFRAAHSIKGGAATFGFSEVAAFTHGVETLLDEMRSGKRRVSADTTQVLLQACDCLREMMAAIESDTALNAERMADLERQLLQILSTEASKGADIAERRGAADRPVISRWRIQLSPTPGFFKAGHEAQRVFQALQQLGTISVQCDVGALPELALMDPTLCYLRWNVEIVGSTGVQQIEDVLTWIDDACSVHIARGEEPSAPRAGSPDPAPPERGGSIRVATEKVDKIINLVGELLITQSMLGGFSDSIDVNDMNRLRQGLAQLARNTRQLQESVMQIRMLPISFAFNRFPRLVHDLSRSLGKSVQLKFSGEGTELDKTVLEKISDPLVHLVRNALDHGLETPERRLAAGKSETGTLELSAYHEGGSIIIEVNDDGAGLNRGKILQRARERALVASDQELSEEQIDNLIFMPGFSTADQISDVSGRGVGMDVVRRNINDLGGHVQISSQQGAGSRIRIRLPLTLAILDGQLVRVGSEVYIISLLAIVETIQIKRERLSTLGGKAEVFRLRDEVLPVIRLYDLFGIKPDSRDVEDGLLVIAEADGVRVGILVDDLMAQQQVVIKSLEANFKPVLGLAGATILGDGTVSLIIDVPGLIRAAGEARGVRPIPIDRAA